MTKMVTTCLCICLLSIATVVPVWAQAGSIGIFADPSGTDCNLVDLAPEMIFFYVVHVGTTGAKGSIFYAPRPACLNALYITTTCGGITLRCDAQTEVSAGYGDCLSSPILAATIQYLGQGTTGSCCYYPVLPSPHHASGEIVVFDCDDNPHYATGGTAIVNPAMGCLCDVPADPSTWGRVKSLYQ